MASCNLNTSVQTELGCIPKDPVQFVGQFYKIGLSLIGGVALLYIIYGGYLIAMSQGNPQQLEKGKRYVFYSIVGILVAIFAAIIIQVVTVNILHVPGFTK
jgi:hypothetical protein